MKIFGQFVFISGVLLLLFVFCLSGPVNRQLAENYKKQGFFESIAKEWNGENEVTRAVVNSVSGYNKLLMGCGFVCVLAGAAAWGVGTWNQANRRPQSKNP